MPRERIPTTVIGSMPKPHWLVPAENIRTWKLSGDLLAQAQDDATLLSIRDQEKAGIDVITDGEQRRMYYMSRLISQLAGIDAQGSNIANVADDTVDDAQPRVVGPIERAEAFSLDDLKFLKAHTDRRVKMTLPGPMVVIMVLKNEHYNDQRKLAFAIAEALNQEMLDLQAAGCDVIQLDEAYAIFKPDEFRAWGREAMDIALKGIHATTCVHFCFGYRQSTPTPTERPRELLDQFRSIIPEIAKCQADQFAFECACSGVTADELAALPADKQIVYGVVDNACTQVEDPLHIAEQLRHARKVFGPDRLWAAPDCGFVWLPPDVARAKLNALVLGARLAEATM